MDPKWVEEMVAASELKVVTHYTCELGHEQTKEFTPPPYQDSVKCDFCSKIMDKEFIAREGFMRCATCQKSICNACD